MAKSPAAQTFGSILDRAPADVEKPKPLPQGSYITSVVGQPRYDKSSKKQTPFVEFTLKVISAGDDVDADELEAFLEMPDGSKKKLSEITIKNTLYDTPAAGYRIKEFVQHCGLNVGDEATGAQGDFDTLREAVESTAGQQVGVYVNHEPFQSGDGFMAKINRTFVAE